jgi:hypothetical protein
MRHATASYDEDFANPTNKKNNTPLVTKSWIKMAIAHEESRPDNILWNGEPTLQQVEVEHQNRIKFLRKQTENNAATLIAKRLAHCELNSRCCSGSCPSCSRLIQRWFVRRSKRFIADHLDLPNRQLVAINIVPSNSIVAPNSLNYFSLADLQRRLKFALKKTAIKAAIGAVDFSFNEHQDNDYEPFWCPHIYLITADENIDQAAETLRDIYKSSKQVPRPIKISEFQNKASRRSYALKMNFRRRIGYWESKETQNGEKRKRRNTATDRLRAKERLELYIYLHQTGFASRMIFYNAKPIIKLSHVTIMKIDGRIK